jgi:hypothetical protein
MDREVVKRVLSAVNKLDQIENSVADGIEEWLFDSKAEAEAALKDMRFVGEVWEFELEFVDLIVDAETHLDDMMDPEDAGKWVLQTYCEARAGAEFVEPIPEIA